METLLATVTSSLGPHSAASLSWHGTMWASGNTRPGRPQLWEDGGLPSPEQELPTSLHSVFSQPSLPQLSPTETTLGFGPGQPIIMSWAGGRGDMPAWEPGRMLTSLRPGRGFFLTLKPPLPVVPLSCLSVCSQHSVVPAHTSEEGRWEGRWEGRRGTSRKTPSAPQRRGQGGPEAADSRRQFLFNRKRNDCFNLSHIAPGGSEVPAPTCPQLCRGTHGTPVRLPVLPHRPHLHLHSLM